MSFPLTDRQGKQAYTLQVVQGSHFLQCLAWQVLRQLQGPVLGKEIQLLTHSLFLSCDIVEGW
jgi:hypothetical protein